MCVGLSLHILPAFADRHENLRLSAVYGLKGGFIRTDIMFAAPLLLLLFDSQNVSRPPESPRDCNWHMNATNHTASTPH